MRIPLDSRDEMRLRRAMQNSPEYRRQAELRERMEAARQQANKAAQLEKEAFEEWEREDRFLDELIQIRDRHAPKTADEPWDECFCLVLQMIPEQRRYVRELWLDYAVLKRAE